MFINLSTNEYPRYAGDVYLEYPEWDGSDDNLPDNWTRVVETVPPEPLENEVLELGEPAIIDGVWTQQWYVRPLAAEELERMNAPITVKEKLAALGLTDFEIQALANGLVR